MGGVPTNRVEFPDFQYFFLRLRDANLTLLLENFMVMVGTWTENPKLNNWTQNHRTRAKWTSMRFNFPSAGAVDYPDIPNKDATKDLHISGTRFN